MPDGTRLRGVDVRVTNVGGKPTSDSGEFTILLPDQFEPGTEIELYIAGWKILNLYDGRTWVPKSETATIHIIVIRPGQESQFWKTKSQTSTPRSERRLQR